MSVRVRVAVALVVAAVVPLLGVFGIVAFLLPYQVGATNGLRLQEAATASSSLLARECEAVGDRAALVASRLLGRVALAGDIEPAQAVAEAAQAVVDESQEDPWTVLVLSVDGEVLARGGDDARALVADVPAVRDLSCRTGELGDPATLTVVLPFRNVEAALGEVVVSSPLDADTVRELTEQVALVDGGLVVVDGGQVVASSGPGTIGGPGSDDEDTVRRHEDALDLVVRRVAAMEESGEPESQVKDQPVFMARALGEDVTVVAVGQASPAVDQRLAVAFVVTAVGTAALVWLLSASLTRPITELAELARRIAAGDEPVAADGVSGDPDEDVQGVSAVLGSLARDLRASEADAQRRHGAFLDAFSRFGDALQQTHDRDGLLQTVLQAALLAAEAPMGLALHHDRSSRLSRRELSLRARSRADGPAQLDDLTRRTLSEVAERALDERTVIELPGTDERGPVLAVPLGSTSRPLGAVVVARDVGAPTYDAVAFEAIGALATSAGKALANIKEHQEVERLSVTDPLTGVNNFRHLSTMLAREMERATRFGHPLGVLMLDIDRFKPVNDTYGHAAGDAVLRELARRVKECVREVDTVARYGGEEFALLLPETDLDGAERLGGRVLVAIRSEPFRLPDGTVLPITASMGVAGFPHHGATATEVMGAADAALYRAKDGGRDRVEVARTSEEATAVSAVGPGPGLGSPDGDRAP